MDDSSILGVKATDSPVIEVPASQSPVTEDPSVGDSPRCLNLRWLNLIGQQNLAFGLKFNAKGVVDCYEKDFESLPYGQRRDIDFKMIEGDFEVFEGKWSIEKICGLEWNRHHKEIVSGHGYSPNVESMNSLSVSRYPSMVKAGDLWSHLRRVLQLTQSPDGSTLVSAGADETIRFWDVLGPQPPSKRPNSMLSLNAFRYRL